MRKSKVRHIWLMVLVSFTLFSIQVTPSFANPNSSACKKVKSSVKKLDEKNLSNWKKFDAMRDSMGTLNFSNTDYKKSLSLLRTVYRSDLDMFSTASRNSKCYTSEDLGFVSTSYDQTVEKLASLNTIISNSSKNTESKFNSMKETIWLWIAGEYINYFTLDGRTY